MADDERHFGLVRSFQIDDDELDGLTPQMIFTLGYECKWFDDLIDARKPFSQLAHSENVGRIQAYADRRKVPIRVRWLAGDSAESWVEISHSGREEVVE